MQELGAKYDVVDIPADLADIAAEWREKLIEAVCELDDDAMLMYLEVGGWELEYLNCSGGGVCGMLARTST